MRAPYPLAGRFSSTGAIPTILFRNGSRRPGYRPCVHERESRLRAAGLRVTRPRVAVLEALDEARTGGEHLLVAGGGGGTRGRLGSGSTQAGLDRPPPPA